MKFLLKQAILSPLYFLVPVLIAGALTDGYSAISQHASEIALMGNSPAKMILNTGAISAGLSCVLLSIGLLGMNKKRNLLSAILLSIFGISMISNGIFPMGSPMHGLYGIGLCLMILPFVSCYELKGSAVDKKYFPITIAAGLLIFIYLWLVLIGLDPPEYKGLIQRIASLITFGWIAYFAYAISKIVPVIPKEEH